MELISMTNFVLEKDNNDLNEKVIESIFEYANFLKQPLKLGMFVPCNENGTMLDDPGLMPSQELQDYRKAKERVLFEGFVYTDSQKTACLDRIPLSVSPYGINDEKLQLTKRREDGVYQTWLQLSTIEDLVQCKLNLTQSAINQIKKQ